MPRKKWAFGPFSAAFWSRKICNEVQKFFIFFFVWSKPESAASTFLSSRPNRFVLLDDDPVL
jgi:hypothetical protein